MLVSTDWIKEFVEVPKLSPKELGEKFTLSCAEVEDVITSNAHLSKMSVAEIIDFKQHPDADKLRIVTFDIGESNPRQVVCGASNVRKGLKTPYCPTGVTLPIGLTLEPKKIRGVLSEGMLCSEEELALAEKSEGIMELPADAKVGQDMLSYFNESEDIILDIDNKSLTHRPDLWGHYGLAREFSALFRNALKNPFDSTWESNLNSKIHGGNSPIRIELDKDSSGILYYGLSIDNVKIEESPSWIKNRLIACGLRPINNIVDISNYVMLELGIPLHIFDREKISGDKVVIKRVGNEQEFTTLDEVSRKLVPEDTVICDESGPLVLAGIMGGLSSGVSDSTQNIFIEVANWKASEVRKTSTRLGLRTDSSSRYEKTLDSKLFLRTLYRTFELVMKLCPQAKAVGKIEHDGLNPKSVEEVHIETSFSKIKNVLGIEIKNEEIQDILNFLDFKVVGVGDVLKIQVPSYRATKDIEVEDDIIEEVGRIIGYDNIEPASPPLDVRPTKLLNKHKIQRKVRDYLVMHAKNFEVMTYPLVGEADYKKSSYPYSKDSLVLKNALSTDADRMRESMIPSFLKLASVNSKHQDDFRVFELGRVYRPTKDFSNEENTLALAYYSKSSKTYIDLLNDVKGLLNFINIPFDIAEKHPKFKSQVVDEEWIGIHPYEFNNIRIMGKMSGSCLSVHPHLLRSYKIKGSLSIALINLSAFDEREIKEKLKYKPLPKFPSSSFDWTVVADSKEPIGNILNAVKKIKIKELNWCKVVDTFSMDDQKKSVTLRAHFSDPEKTLDNDFLTSSKDKLVSGLTQAGFPLKV